MKSTTTTILSLFVLLTPALAQQQVTPQPAPTLSSAIPTSVSVDSPETESIPPECSAFYAITGNCEEGDENSSASQITEDGPALSTSIASCACYESNTFAPDRLDKAASSCSNYMVKQGSQMTEGFVSAIGFCSKLGDVRASGTSGAQATSTGGATGGSSGNGSASGGDGKKAEAAGSTINYFVFVSGVLIHCLN